ncbi:hypothetical protein KUCAC02_025213, partial [Chaenocephalus aceratus]
GHQRSPLGQVVVVEQQHGGGAEVRGVAAGVSVDLQLTKTSQVRNQRTCSRCSWDVNVLTIRIQRVFL